MQKIGRKKVERGGFCRPSGHHSLGERFAGLTSNENCVLIVVGIILGNRCAKQIIRSLLINNVSGYGWFWMESFAQFVLLFIYFHNYKNIPTSEIGKQGNTNVKENLARRSPNGTTLSMLVTKPNVRGSLGNVPLINSAIT